MPAVCEFLLGEIENPDKLLSDIVVSVGFVYSKRICTGDGWNDMQHSMWIRSLRQGCFQKEIHDVRNMNPRCAHYYFFALRGVLIRRVYAGAC